MRLYPILCAVLAVMFFALPVSAVTTLPLLTVLDTEDSALNSLDGANKFGYLYVESVEYTMNNADATIQVRYEIEPWISFLVYLFGKQDLKKRVLGVLQYPEKGYESTQDIEFSYIDSSKALLTLRNAALDNQDNSYWIRPHTFGCTIPTLSFAISGSDIKNYKNVKSMEKGIGFFRS